MTAGLQFRVPCEPRLVLGFCVLWMIVILWLSQSVAGTLQEMDVEYLGTFSSKGSGQGELLHPEGLSVDLLGNVYVADTGNNRIMKFTANGRFLVERGGFGWEGENLDGPVDVCAQVGLDVFVADRNNGRIVRYDQNLQYIEAYRRDPAIDFRFGFGYPTSVTLTPEGDVFLVDGENMRILKINNSGEILLGFGGLGQLTIPLEDPVQITADATGRVYVSDRGAGVVQVFDHFGNELLQLTVPDRSWEPLGIGIGPASTLFVADGESRSILHYSHAGVLLSQISGATASPESWVEPVDCAWRRNRLYVLDGTASVVHMFRIPE